jgi:hypothetical protein
MTNATKQKTQNRRRKLIVDRHSQGAITWHLIRFWLFGGLVVAIMPLTAMVIWSALIENAPRHVLFSWITEVFWFPALVAVLVLPPGIWYSIRFSNRIAGPVTRIQREIHRLICNEPGEDVSLRDGDLFRELADSFNALRRRVGQIEARNRYLESMLAARPRVHETKSRRSGSPGLFPDTGNTWLDAGSMAQEMQ